MVLKYFDLAIKSISIEKYT